MIPPWACNYTMNCNANFNYLGVEAANLSELHEPFLRLIKEWSIDGARTAKTWFGCKGWVGNITCDLWRNACPVGGVWCATPSCSAWTCQHLWEHYLFTQDQAYLREVWPVMRGNAEFFLDFLVIDPKTGYLAGGPDTNFENHILKPDGSVVLLCQGPTPTNMMVRQLFRNCIAASQILGTDAEFRAKLEKALPQLPPTVINPRDGEIQEFLDPEDKIANRGLCELLTTWALICCDQITPRRNPELAAALRRSYEAPDRRPWIQGGIGSWQTAFPANTYARLGDGDRVAELLARHFQSVVNVNLSARFMHVEWEIDGNLGVMAAIGEMLLQSHTGEIELLPALPKTWKEGSVKGLKARGNITVDIAWKDGQVTSYRLRSPSRQPVKLRINGEVKTVTPEK
jgi:alpha-L-fucosidase 2